MDKLILVGSVFIGFDFIIKRLSICRLAEDKIDIRINLLNEKIKKLENRIETLEDFRLKVYDKNFLFTEKREWEESGTDYETDEEEID